MNSETLRRSTPLARKLAARIAADGPIGVDEYMRVCLSDPDHGYYTSRSGIGRDGDFTTAPEVSQVFGELIGLWSVVVWQQMGSPGSVNLVELGPGRGVLMDDALRAAKLVPGFIEALDVHLCEINPLFRTEQANRLNAHGVEPKWHTQLDDAPDGATIIIANEFLDTFPASLWRRQTDDSWSEINVGMDEAAELSFGSSRATPPFSAEHLPTRNEGQGDEQGDAIYTHAEFDGLARQLAAAAARGPLAALFIDYGHTETGWGDTLQAVRDHEFEHPLTSPGEADVSIAVDFAAFERTVAQQGLICDGPVMQADFLGQLGLAERVSALMSANPKQAGTLESGAFRLMAAPGMGSRFKALTVKSPALPVVPGFSSPPE